MRRLNNRLASALLCFVYQNKITAEGETDKQTERERGRGKKDRQRETERGLSSGTVSSY